MGSSAAKTGSGQPPVGFADHDHAACQTGGMRIAEQICAARSVQFTPVRRRALEILLESHKAMGAYEVLARLEADGFGSKPPVAYRALGFLVDNGLAHRVERLNAFVACAHPAAPHDPAFMICRACGHVAETLSDQSLDGPAEAAGFTIENAVIEAQGVCPECRDVVD